LTRAKFRQGKNLVKGKIKSRTKFGGGAKFVIFFVCVGYDAALLEKHIISFKKNFAQVYSG